MVIHNINFMNMRKLLIIVIVFTIVNNTSAQTDTMIDSRDGKIYKTIKIGSQIWMVENLAYAPSITYLFLKPNITESGIYCYGDDTINCGKYGMLYTWEAALKACPAGWHLPSESEFAVLLNYVGGEKEKEKSYNALMFNDSFKFNLVLGGWLHNGNTYHGIERISMLWSTSVKNSPKILVINKIRGKAYISTGGNSSALSVRCIKD